MGFPTPYENIFSTGDFQHTFINVDLAGEMTIVTSSPTPREGTYCCRVFADNSLNSNDDHRTQRGSGENNADYLLLDSSGNYEYWGGFSIYTKASEWPIGWQGDGGGNVILWQYNGGLGGPELHFQGRQPDDDFRWYGVAPSLPATPWPKDRWVDIVVAVVRSATGQGRTRIWQDGTLVYDRSNISNIKPEHVGLNVINTWGIYWSTLPDRPGWESTCYFDSLRLYRSSTLGEDHYGDVAPQDAPPPPLPSTTFAYNGTPFTLTDTRTVKAIAVKSGWTNSPIAEATFTKIVEPPVIPVPSKPTGLIFMD